MSNSAARVCFHPKIYAFYYRDRKTKFLVGSANITAGGFGTNWECSLLVQQDGNKEISKILNDLIENKYVKEISRKCIADYRKKHQAARVFRTISEVEITRVEKDEMRPLEPLEAVVRTLRSWDPSPRGLQKLSAERAESAANACGIIDKIIDGNPNDEALFQENIEKLRGCFHASQLERQFHRFKKQRKEFQQLLIAAKKAQGLNQNPQRAYESLMKKEILGVGPNWASEILHALNPNTYAVLNRNSVSGMGLARKKFPPVPNKINISGEVYGRFCRNALELTNKLGLRNTSELDAVFNHAYFNYEGEVDEEEEE